VSFQQKRDWKRIDPEPPKPCTKCEWRDWESQVWFATAIVSLLLLMVIFLNTSEVAHGEGQVPRRTPAVHR